MKRTKVLLIDRKPRAGRALNGWLRRRGLSVTNVKHLDDAIEELSDFTTGSCVDVIMLPIAMSAESICSVQDAIRFSCDDQQVEVVTFSRPTAKTRDQLEAIFSPQTPVATKTAAPRAV